MVKILELTTYSAGGCGVWARVKQEALLLKKRGHEVRVFSSDHTKGEKRSASSQETIEGLKVRRFPGRKLGGESFMRWYNAEVEKEVRAYNPDIIIAHAYRHFHTTAALRTARKIGAKIFLVTHAPFIDRNTTRSLLAAWSVNLYDTLFGSKTINRFDKIITITKWEEEFLDQLGVQPDKLGYIPNGIAEEFFKQKRAKSNHHKILFLGRISPIKNIEILLESLALLSSKSISLEIVGPAEKDYLELLKNVVKRLNLESRVTFSPPIYNTKKKIAKLDSASIFVLPSKREAMPQALIEAMARGLVVVTSDNPGSKEIVTSGKNGFLFKNGDAKDLAKKIENGLKSEHASMRASAATFVQRFRWENLIEKLDVLIESAVKHTE